MQTQRNVRLFRNGRNQAVRIPREFELDADEAVIRKDGTRLIIEPIPKKSLLELLSGWDSMDEEFPEIKDTPVQAENIF